METLQTAIASREDTGPFKKPLFDKKDHCNDGDHNETNYVDLGNPSDMKSDSAKTVKVTFTGEGSQLAIFKSKGDASVSIKSPVEREDNENVEKSLPEECFNNADIEKCYAERLSGERAPLIRVPSEDEFTEDESKKDADLKNEDSKHETEELQYTDMYLNSRCESKDSTSAADVESHYITTHEIQLTEQDHDVDYEVGRGSCWDFEDDNLVYSFVDYASFESDETTRKRIQSKVKSNKVQPSLRAAKLCAPGALVSTESELCESDKCASSDEGVGKTQHDRRNTTGPIHLSIKTSSRAINEHVNVLQQKNVRFHTRRAAERQYSFRSSDSKSETLYDRCFIPPPGRQHLASKLGVKDINEYSSGASSSVSELDDADKEVRNLTARSFRSLACPYFDTIHLSSSSESSMSEHSLSINKWSAFVDLNYSNLTQGLDQNMLARRNSTPIMEGNNSAEYKNNKDVLHTNIPNPQTNILSLKNNLNSRQASSGSSKKIEIRSKPGSTETITLETLNFSCNVGGGIPARERRAKRSLDAMASRSTAEVMGIAPAKPVCETESQVRETSETFEDTHKKAIFASSLLKNIISKKMQFEQELKMERGEICDTHTVPSLCSQYKDLDAKKEKEEMQSENSETESGHSQEERKDVTDIVYCVSDVEPPETMRSQPAELTESPCDPGIAHKLDPSDAPHIPLTPSQTSAFKTWKDGQQESEAQGEGDPQCALEYTQPNTSTERVLESSECVEGESSKMIKMSHLYVPSSQLMPKEKEAVGLSLHNLKVNGDVAESDGGGCAKLGSGQLRCSEDTDKTSPCRKAPEIKIRIRSVKENQGNRLNIANLLTPNIQYSVNPKKATNESKTNLLNITDKVPHFMVRDIRDSKCKFQTPIHQVRDVRKLVKSSYRFVALENASGTLREDGKPSVRAPDKKPFPTPMVIKCQSVNTNSATNHDPVNVSSKEESEIVPETARTSPNLPSECASKSDGARAPARAPCAKQLLTEQHEFSLKIDAKKSDCCEKKPDSKVSNQIALEKLKAAVKTMEQLYVFDRNEWKRKTQAPRPITDSHVLSLITREEQGVATKTDLDKECGRADNEKFTSSQLHTEKLATASCVGGVIDEDKMCMPTSSHSQKELVAQRADYLNNKCVFRVGGNLNAPAQITVANESTQQICSSRNYTHKAPLSLKICPSKAKIEDRNTVLEHQRHLPSDSSDNYLTIPVKASNSKLPQPPKPSHQPLQRSPIVMKSWSPETQTATIYHQAVALPAVPAIPAPQPQVLCLTPPADPLPPHIQRKLLLDPTTGQYYLVDTPVPMQPAAQRFYHPESGQYLDIPFSLTPVPVSVSPVTFSPAAYPPTYLVYPSTMLATHPHLNTQSHSSTCSEGDDTVETGSLCMIQPGVAVPSSTKPVISITSQQSARIVAPPSFDGTTMSFVVEHR
ncbi:DNA repair protein complementing XP-A cells isoform X1 [Triplophysa rosa]|uniref:DNA repair protein complementing XP-A cells isoform X1 n=1 Tax=Triplophysa rosa TaxID=992332 RepID=UPI002545E713|nr:DNA repair protein complementing XP-A cells isoform X1 [Triplophysa rosa]